MAKGKGGRPTVITEQVLQKLREAFLMGCTDAEACLYADIAPSTFYDYQAATEGFSEQKAIWKDNPMLKARINIINALDEGDKDISKWYAERKRKDEFSTRQENTGANGVSLFEGVKVEVVDTNNTNT